MWPSVGGLRHHPDAQAGAVQTIAEDRLRSARISRALLEILRRRYVARVGGGGEELLRIVGPELADIGEGFDDGVHQLTVLALDLADVHAQHRLAVLVAADWTLSLIHIS